MSIQVRSIAMYLKIQDSSGNETVIPIQANYGVTSRPHDLQNVVTHGCLRNSSSSREAQINHIPNFPPFFDLFGENWVWMMTSITRVIWRDQW